MKSSRIALLRTSGAGGVARPAAALVGTARRVHAGLLRRWWIRRGAMTDARVCPTVVIAPHQDDETIGCGGLIALKRQAGAAVTVVVLTDGSNHRGRDARAAASDVAALRRSEALAATAALGVGGDHVHFLDCPDGGLATLAGEPRDRAVGRLADLLATARPDEVYVTHRRDGHPDHEAAHALVRLALARAGSTAALLQYPIWITWLRPLGLGLWPSDLAGARTVSIRAVLDKKRRALACYPSQLGTLPRHFLDSFGLPYEVFFADPAARAGATDVPQSNGHP